MPLPKFYFQNKKVSFCYNGVHKEQQLKGQQKKKKKKKNTRFDWVPLPYVFHPIFSSKAKQAIISSK